MTGPKSFNFTPSWAPSGLERLPLWTTTGFACPYLPGRTARNQVLVASEARSEDYHALMDRGFRRSGRMIYRPDCVGCTACRPLRVEVDRFRANKSQRRCWRRNQDLSVTVGHPRPTEEKYALYRRYIAHCHDGTGIDYENYIEFLYTSPVETREFLYRDGDGKLLGVGICDVCPASISTVYFYRDPDEPKRSLGVFSALWEIDYARRQSIPHYYLGFWIQGSRKMMYKADFQPHQVLDCDGQWVDMG